MKVASSSPAALPHAAAFAATPRFRPTALLGVGASGSVYSAWDCELREQVAVKVLHFSDSVSRARLERQIEALAGVAHPSLVQTHGLVELGDKLAIVMGLVEGQDFMRFVRAGLPVPGFDEERLASCLAQLVGALSALHAAYYVHRDVKPSNLRVTHDGRLVLLDLGTAAELSDLEEPGVGVGTPAYMAPEQAVGEPIARAADFYAVGVVLYEVLTGALPHPDAARRPMVKFIDEVASVQGLVPGVPAQLAELTLRLLSQKAQARPTARQILAGLGLPMSAAGTLLPPSLRAPLTLLGRAEARAALDEVMRLSRASDGRWVHVRARRGDGKTQLVRDLATRVGSEAGLVAVSSFRCALASAYGALDPLVETLAERLSRMPALDAVKLEDAPWLTRMWPCLLRVPWLGARPGAARAVDPLRGRMAAESLLAELLRHVARQEPLLVVLEDVDVASVDALRVLESVLSEPLTSPLCIVTTAAHATPLDALGARPLVLPACEAGLRAQLVVHMWSTGGGEGPPPLALADEPATPRACLERVRARLLGQDAPDERAALEQRIRALPADTLHVLSLVCVSRMPAGRELLGSVAMLEGVHIRTHLARLLDAALITRTADVHDAVVFAAESDAVTEVLTALLGEAAVSALHFDWGTLLASSASGAALHAFEHLRHAAQPALAAEQALLAADAEGQRLAFASAADLRVAADELVPATSSAVARTTLRALCDALALAGRPREAAAACARAARDAGPSEALELAGRRTELLLRAGCFKEGLAAASEVLRAVDLTLPKTTQRALVSLVWHRALLGLRGLGYAEQAERQLAPRSLAQIDALLDTATMLAGVEPIIGTELLARGLRRALAVGEPRRVARALMRECASQSLLEAPPLRRARALLLRAGTMVDAVDDDELRAHFVECSALVQLQSFDMRAAALAFESASAAQLGQQWVSDNRSMMVHQCLLQAQFFTGDLSGLCRAYGPLLRRAERLGDVQARMTYTGAVGVFVGLMQDEPERAARELDAAMALLPADAVYLHHVFEVISRASLVICLHDAAGVAGVLDGIQRLRVAIFARIGMLRAVFDVLEASLRLVRAAFNPALRDAELRLARRLVPRRCAYPLLAAEWTRVRAALCLWDADRAGATRAFRAYLLERTALGCSTVSGEYVLGVLEGDAAGQARTAEARQQLEAEGVKNVPRFARLFGLFGAGELGL